MAEIPVFRMHAEEMKKEKFVAIAAHLGLRGDTVATHDAFFMQDKQRALAYAMPGARFAGLLFYTDASQGISPSAASSRAPSGKVAEDWSETFLKRFQLLPRASADSEVRTSFRNRSFMRESMVEEGDAGRKTRRVPLSAEVAVDVRANDIQVTGPRARVRMAFKAAKSPAWIHRGMWERLEVFERRPLFSEDDVFRRLSNRLSARGASERPWRLVGMRLAYFAGESCGGPDVLLPYYFAEVEFREPKREAQDRQGPRQLIQLPACP